MKSVFLMSKPEFFDVSYIINPWMNNQIGKVQQKLAQQQWKKFHQTLTQQVEIKLIDCQPNLPDMVFTANAGVVQGKAVLISNFRFAERKPETPFFIQWFEKNNYNIHLIPNHIAFEGEGDALIQPDSNLLWLGYGIRSDIEAVPYVQKFFNNFELIPLKLNNKAFYHLDTCFCPLFDDFIMFFPEAFDEQSRKIIKKRIPKEKRIVLSAEDAFQFAANSICIANSQNQRSIITNYASTSLTQKLGQLGYDIHIADTSEFIRAGGATKCLVLRL